MYVCISMCYSGRIMFTCAWLFFAVWLPVVASNVLMFFFLPCLLQVFVFLFFSFVLFWNKSPFKLHHGVLRVPSTKMASPTGWTQTSRRGTGPWSTTSGGGTDWLHDGRAGGLIVGTVCYRDGPWASWCVVLVADLSCTCRKYFLFFCWHYLLALILVLY